MPRLRYVAKCGKAWKNVASGWQPAPDQGPGQAHDARAVVLPGFSSGFTLPELVIVLVIIGILAAFAAPRLDVAGFQRQIFADELTNALRHARKVALHSGCPVEVDAGTTSVTASYTGAGGPACPAGALPHPSRGGDFVFNGEITSGATFTFDALGRSSGAQIVTGSGDTIVIEAGSGYVRR